jgi:KaiC/GvpD/RAD55 family RecA-like ATPase
MGNGEWGSGKTYFLKKNIKCKLEELNYKVLYVSLNGVSSIQEIYSQLASEKSRTLKFFKDNKAARIGLKIANSVGDVFLRAIRYDVSDDNKSIGDVDPNSGDIPKLSIKDFL